MTEFSPYWTHERETVPQDWNVADLPDPDMNESDMPIPLPEEQFKRCPICGGLNPGDITHARCM
jgi:hypothetical protein